MNISEVQRKMLQQEYLLRCDSYFLCVLYTSLFFLLIMILQVNYDFFNRVKLRMSFFDSEKL